MTKERKIAIAMWEFIERQLLDALDEDYNEDEDNVSTIGYLKEEFAEKHEVKWKYNCYLCHYFPCSKCPLNDGYSTCDSRSLYGTITNPNLSYEVRASAARAIIDILKGNRNENTSRHLWYFIGEYEYIHIYDIFREAVALANKSLDHYVVLNGDVEGNKHVIHDLIRGKEEVLNEEVNEDDF